MKLEGLLGRYRQEEQIFLRKVKKERENDIHSTESRGGMMRIGRKIIRNWISYVRKRESRSLWSGCKVLAL